ncbi:hypothetical protein ACA910_017280 [Epithemia clementina (nom. ined.)]
MRASSRDSCCATSSRNGVKRSSSPSCLSLSSSSSSCSSSSSSVAASPPPLPNVNDWEQAYVELVSQHPEWVGMERYALEVMAAASKHDYNHHNHNDNYNNNENTQNPMKPRLGKQQRRRQQLLLLQELQQQPHTYDNNFAMMSSSSSSSYWTGRPPRWSLLRFPTAEPNAEFLRHSCESISRPSRTFAHRIAQLQATTRISLA